MGVAADTLAPGFGGGAELLFVKARQAAIIKQVFASHPNMFYAFAAAGID